MDLYRQQQVRSNVDLRGARTNDKARYGCPCCRELSLRDLRGPKGRRLARRRLKQIDVSSEWGRRG
jgi:hypothetical protein